MLLDAQLILKENTNFFIKVYYIIIISNCQLCILKRQDICTYITQILIPRQQVNKNVSGLWFSVVLSCSLAHLFTSIFKNQQLALHYSAFDTLPGI